MQLQDYFAAYRSLKLTRDADGVLVAEFHSKGGPFTFTAQDHTEFVDAFYRIAQDRKNKIVILTGAGGEFIPEIDFSSFGNVAVHAHQRRRFPRSPCQFNGRQPRDHGQASPILSVYRPRTCSYWLVCKKNR